MGTGGAFCKVMGWDETDHLPPYCAESKNAWSCTSRSLYTSFLLCLIKHVDDFTFTCLLYCILLWLFVSSVFKN